MNNLSATRASNNISHADFFAGNKTQPKGDLSMNDFLMLMVTELQNQSIDSNADTSQMLSQMVMMQMVDAMTNMTQASIMGYAASLVGKTVTVGEVDSNGRVQEVVGTVTGTGVMNGEQVVFVNDKYYYMNQIIAVGTLPAEKPNSTDGTEKPEGVEKPESSDKPESTETPNVTENQENVENPGFVEKPEAPSENQNVENNQQNEDKAPEVTF